MNPTPLKRSKSGRDPRKSEGQRMALEGSTVPSPAAPKSYNLIVCGATNYKHGFIFSDFMGFCMALGEQGVGGDFLSCFPLERHFMYLKNEHHPPIDTIKFGKVTPDGERYVYSYSRHSYLNRQYWFRQVGASILLNEVERWISEKKQQAREGDVVNIVFECHGVENCGLKIGNKILHRYVFRDMISGFQDGVQINAIMDACYSGPFVDVIKDSTEEHRYATAASDEKAWSFTRSASNRIRNSRFSQAFVQSLAKLNLPGAPRRKVTWRLKDHEDLIRDMTMRNITPNANITTPRFYSSPPMNGMSAVENMVFRKKVDVLFDPREMFCRRRMEWPTGDMNIWQTVQGDPDSEHVPQFAKTLVDGELSKCDTATGFVPDIDIFDEVYVHHPRYRSLLRNLYWRARRQSAIWQIFKMLLHRAYIDPICLCLSVDFDQCSTSNTIVSLLKCFSFMEKDVEEILNDNIPLQSAEWDKDLKWFAIMIIRGGEDIVSIFNLIATTGVFGKCNIERLGEIRQEHPELIFHKNPRDCILYQGTKRFNQKFGLWLPHGLESEKFQDQFSECEKHFELIESAFQQSEQQLPSNIGQYGASEDNEVLTVPVEWSPTVPMEADSR